MGFHKVDKEMPLFALGKDRIDGARVQLKEIISQSFTSQ